MKILFALALGLILFGIFYSCTYHEKKKFSTGIVPSTCPYVNIADTVNTVLSMFLADINTSLKTISNTSFIYNPSCTTGTCPIQSTLIKPVLNTLQCLAQNCPGPVQYSGAIPISAVIIDLEFDYLFDLLSLDLNKITVESMTLNDITPQACQATVILSLGDGVNNITCNNSFHWQVLNSTKNQICSFADDYYKLDLFNNQKQVSVPVIINIDINCPAQKIALVNIDSIGININMDPIIDTLVSDIQSTLIKCSGIFDIAEALNILKPLLRKNFPAINLNKAITDLLLPQLNKILSSLSSQPFTCPSNLAWVRTWNDDKLTMKGCNLEIGLDLACKYPNGQQAFFSDGNVCESYDPSIICTSQAPEDTVFNDKGVSYNFPSNWTLAEKYSYATLTCPCDAQIIYNNKNTNATVSACTMGMINATVSPGTNDLVIPGLLDGSYGPACYYNTDGTVSAKGKSLGVNMGPFYCSEEQCPFSDDAQPGQLCISETCGKLGSLGTICI